MKHSEVDALENVFFERHFEFGEDIQTVQSNLKIAQTLCQQFDEKACSLANQIVCGEVVESMDAILTIQNYLFAHRFFNRFQDEARRYSS